MSRSHSLAATGVVAAVVLVVPVLAEIVWPEFGDEGHVVFAASQLVGWVLVARLCLGAVTAWPVLDESRAGRLGRRLLLAGCGCQVLFALVYGATAAATGEPLEASFVLFLLGFLAQLVGGIAWTRAMLRERPLRAAGAAVLGTAVLGFLAMAVGVDPFHDVFLLGSYAAWAAVGLGLSRAGRGPGRAGAPATGLVSGESR